LIAPSSSFTTITTGSLSANAKSLFNACCAIGEYNPPAPNQALLSINAAKKYKLNIIMLVLNQITSNNLDNEEALNAYTDVNHHHLWVALHQLNLVIQQQYLALHWLFRHSL
jgi:hypothetical protein